MEDVTTAIELINAGGIVAVLVILLAGFYSGRIMSRKTHEEIEEKQAVIVDKFVEKINGSFKSQEESLGIMFQDYTDWKKEWRDGLDKMDVEFKEMTDTLRSIDEGIRRMSDG